MGSFHRYFLVQFCFLDENLYTHMHFTTMIYLHCGVWELIFFISSQNSKSWFLLICSSLHSMCTECLLDLFCLFIISHCCVCLCHTVHHFYESVLQLINLPLLHPVFYLIFFLSFKKLIAYAFLMIILWYFYKHCCDCINSHYSTLWKHTAILLNIQPFLVIFYVLEFHYLLCLYPHYTIFKLTFSSDCSFLLKPAFPETLLWKFFEAWAYTFSLETTSATSATFWSLTGYNRLM